MTTSVQNWTAKKDQPVQMIPIADISVINPRARTKKVFDEIVASISAIGLKKPITVTLSKSRGKRHYDLVCGQGRLEACQALGQTEIPAFIVEADRESGMIMGLVENVARRPLTAVDLLEDIQRLRRDGYESPEIARKTGLSTSYVNAVQRLLDAGEHRLLRAVEAGDMPISIALQVADSDDTEVQQVLRQAYDSKSLRGRQLIAARRLVEERRRRGKRMASVGRHKLTVQSLLRTYREDTRRKRSLIRKAESTRDSLAFVTAGLRTLFGDSAFLALLRAERLDNLPKNLAVRVSMLGENPNGKDQSAS